VTNSIPHELIFGEIYIPPLLLVVALAYLLTSIVSAISVRFDFYKYIAVPAIAELSLLIIFTGLIGRLIII
jgi:hypothetical protein